MMGALLAAWALSPMFAGIDQGFRQGDRSWGPSGCGPVTVWFYWQRATHGFLEYGHASRGEPGAGGRRPCSVAFNIAALPLLDGSGVCMAAWHEDGHLHGRKHSANRRSIMARDVPLYPPRGLCRARRR